MTSVRKFRVAAQGLIGASCNDASFRIHLLMGVAVVVTATVVRCVAWEWCVLLICIGMVWTAELLNSAIETLFKGFPIEVRDQRYPCLDIAAGAVLFASIIAAIVGCVILIPRSLHTFGYQV